MATQRTQQAQQGAGASDIAAQGPRGIGTGVAFDWALSAQILIMAPFFALGVGPGSATAGAPLAARIGIVVASVIAASLIGGIGEALRRGNRYAWMFQMGFNTLLIFDGVFEIPGALHLLSQGLYSGLVRGFVLLIIDPIIVYLLTRPQTRAWIARVTPAEAMARHGGRWVAFVAFCAVIGGALIAFHGYY
ncbi:MAG TPA: hypothetical protein VIC27_07745 [Ktedonobacterales bacterium]|jgi:hypothetical protein